jgi:Na+-transporting NADH:ubiquinone oxidoreductase subunit NqrC
MKPIKLKTFILFLVVICFIGGCRVQAPALTLTPEQQAVKIVSGNQATTLELMNTHISLTSEQVQSEYQARVRAVVLNADVAQLIIYEYSDAITSTYTYRFWKKKI